MPTVCPHCGSEIEDDDNLSYGEKALTAIFGEIGGGTGFGKSLAHQWQSAGEEGAAHRQMLLGMQIQRLMATVDDHNQKDRHHKDNVTTAQQLGALMEWSLQLMQTNDGYRSKMLSAIKNRGLLPEIIDAECETAT